MESHFLQSHLINTSILPVVDYAGYGDSSSEDFKEISGSHYTMIYVTNGSMTISYKDTSNTIKEGSVVFLTKNRCYRLSADGRKKLSFIFINYYMSDFDSKKNTTVVAKTVSSGYQTPQEIRTIYSLPAVTGNITGSVLDKKIHDYIEYFNSSGRLSDLDLNVRFYDIISECIKFNNSLHSAHRKLSDEIITYLSEHNTEQLNTSDMEKRFYLTYKYMGTAFKKETGKTIHSYHTGLRMNYAKRLLLTTNNSIDEISRMLGYSDALYFSRVFKKHYGSSPQTFRKSGK